MTKQEFDEMAALVVRLREDVELHKDALKQSNAHCGKLLVQNEQLHSELVEVRAALASATEQRDSLQRTLDEWSNADTEPHERVAADDVADHVVPVLPFSSPAHENKNVCGIFGCDSKQHGPCPLRFRTPPLTHDEAIEFSLNKVLPLCMRKPAVEPAPALPMCTTCHECGGELRPSPAAGSHSVLYCRTERCSRKNTAWQDDISPYAGPCKSSAPVRHE